MDRGREESPIRRFSRIIRKVRQQFQQVVGGSAADRFGPGRSEAPVRTLSDGLFGLTEIGKCGKGRSCTPVKSLKNR